MPAQIQQQPLAAPQNNVHISASTENQLSLVEHAVPPPALRWGTSHKPTPLPLGRGQEGQAQGIITKFARREARGDADPTSPGPGEQDSREPAHTKQHLLLHLLTLLPALRVASVMAAVTWGWRCRGSLAGTGSQHLVPRLPWDTSTGQDSISVARHEDGSCRLAKPSESSL